MKLTPRLQKIADLVPPGATVWDVGTDHAKLPVWLIQSGKIQRATASDLRPGPLEAALETARRNRLEGVIQLLCCDGLRTDEPVSADTVIIAGMGGETIASILADNPRNTAGIRLILQPMSSVEELRAYLYAGAYTVLGEHLVREKGKRYLILEAVTCGEPEAFDLADTRIGKYVQHSPDYPQLLRDERDRLVRELPGCAADRIELHIQAIQKIKKRMEESEWSP